MIRLEHRFRVPLPVEQAWEVLTDLSTIARCLPGTHLASVVEGRYEGDISIRIGPISATYRGHAHLVERDDVGHRAVVEARGQEAEGAGTASALISLSLQPDGAGTEVQVTSELAISGRAAQCGRSLLAEVGATMLDTLARNLEASIDTVGDPAPASHEQATGMADPAPAPERDAVDLAGDTRVGISRTVPVPVARRSTGYLVGAAIGLLAGIVLGRAGRRQAVA